MKLSALNEAKLANTDPNTQILEKLFQDVRANHPNAKLNDIAHFCAAMMADHIHEDYDRPQIHEMAFEGLPTLKDNPKAINNQLKYYFDEDTWEDYDDLVETVSNFIKDGRLQ